jgi:hypothetical protein
MAKNDGIRHELLGKIKIKKNYENVANRSTGIEKINLKGISLRP